MAKIFQNPEKFIDIGERIKTLSLLNTLMLRYLRKVQRICGEFLADMSNDLPYIFCCVWTFFSSSKRMASNWPGCIYGVRIRETTPSLAPLWLGRKKQNIFWHQSEARTTPTVWNWSFQTLSPEAFFAFLTFLRPNFFLARLDFSPAPQTAPGSPRMRGR